MAPTVSDLWISIDPTDVASGDARNSEFMPSRCRHPKSRPAGTKNLPQEMLRRAQHDMRTTMLSGVYELVAGDGATTRLTTTFSIGTLNRKCAPPYCGW